MLRSSSSDGKQGFHDGVALLVFAERIGVFICLGIVSGRRTVDEEDVPEEQLLVCPECGCDLDYDEDHDEDYCPDCGLIVSGPYPYTAGRPIIYPYGLRI